MKNITLRLL